MNEKRTLLHVPYYIIFQDLSTRIFLERMFFFNLITISIFMKLNSHVIVKHISRMLDHILILAFIFPMLVFLCLPAR